MSVANAECWHAFARFSSPRMSSDRTEFYCQQGILPWTGVVISRQCWSRVPYGGLLTVLRLPVLLESATTKHGLTEKLHMSGR